MNIVDWLIETQKTVDDYVFIAGLTHEILRLKGIETTFIVGENVQHFTVREETIVNNKSVLTDITHKIKIENYVWLVYKHKKHESIIDLIFDYKSFLAKPIILSQRLDIKNLINIKYEAPKNVQSLQSAAEKIYIDHNAQKLMNKILGTNKFTYKRLAQQKSVLKKMFAKIINKRRRREYIKTIVGDYISPDKYPIFKGIL